MLQLNLNSFIKKPNGRNVVVSVNSNDTILNIKTKLENIFCNNHNKESMKYTLAKGHKILENDKTLNDYGIEDEVSLTLTINLTKIHKTWNCIKCKSARSLYVESNKAYCEACATHIPITAAFLQGLKIYLAQKAKDEQ